MNPVQMPLKGKTWRKLEKFADEHPEGCYLNYDTVIEDLLAGKVKNRLKSRNYSNKKESD